MEPLSEAALGVLRDRTIADYLREHCCGTTVFSKQDHGQKLLDHITQQFKLAGLPVPQTYMKSVDNVCDRVKKFTADKTGNFKVAADPGDPSGNFLHRRVRRHFLTRTVLPQRASGR